jgi:hypothetical protein
MRTASPAQHVLELVLANTNWQYVLLVARTVRTVFGMFSIGVSARVDVCHTVQRRRPVHTMEALNTQAAVSPATQRC